jgi:hypothetical protein
MHVGILEHADKTVFARKLLCRPDALLAKSSCRCVAP